MLGIASVRARRLVMSIQMAPLPAGSTSWPLPRWTTAPPRRPTNGRATKAWARSISRSNAFSAWRPRWASSCRPAPPRPKKLRHVQGYLEAGHPGATQIWQSIGVYLGYSLAHYADFYDLKHTLILGRVTSGCGGSLILDGAKAVLAAEFPELAARINLRLPDEKSRHVGQSIAAASLPASKVRYVR